MNAQANRRPWFRKTGNPAFVMAGRKRRCLFWTRVALGLWVGVQFLFVLPLQAVEGTVAEDCKRLPYNQRVVCCTSILETDPCDADALILLVWSMGERQEWDKLLGLLDRLSRGAPSVPQYYTMRARILEDVFSQQEAAIAERKNTEGLDPCRSSDAENPSSVLLPTSENADEILKRASNRFSKSMDYEGAVEDYETYLNLVSVPTSPSVYRNLAGARRQTGDLLGAIDALTLLISHFPEQKAPALTSRARLYRELGNIPLAERDIAEKKLLEEQRIMQEIASLSKKIETNPTDYWAYYQRGRKKLLADDFQGAVSDASDVIEINPSFADAYTLRAEAKTQLGDQEGAEIDRATAAKYRK